jgi:hypothetical protein
MRDGNLLFLRITATLLPKAREKKEDCFLPTGIFTPEAADGARDGSKIKVNLSG